MHVTYTLLQTSNHASTSSLSFYTPDVLPDTQPTVSKHWRFFVTSVQQQISNAIRQLQTLRDNLLFGASSILATARKAKEVNPSVRQATNVHFSRDVQQ